MAGHHPGQQQPHPTSVGNPVYPEQSQATTALVLGLLGVFLMPLLAPFAWAIGSRELAAINAGRRSPHNRQLARIGQVLGIVISVLLILFVVIVFGLLLVSVLL